MEVNISDLTWDQFIYPRGGKSEKTINAYVEALAIGAQFPPIKIQRVFNYPDGNEITEATIILDGIHRWFAFKESRIKKIAAVEWKDKLLDYEKNKVALLLESAQCNINHGDRLSPGDKKRIARDIASTDLECTWTEEALAEKLGVIRQTVNAWISDIRARQKASRNTVILRMSRLGWAQEKIAEVVGLSRNRASEIVGNANFGNIDTLLSQGHDMDYIARHHNMDLPLAWALRLEGKTDQEKFEALGWGLRPWDQWNFNECDERFGDDWPGRIPAQLVAHTLFFFTKPGDLVLDPMAGGGVVSDVCLLFERRCRSFDLAVRDNRPEIRYHHWDAGNKDWPISKKPDLIFFDPPYYRKKAGDYDKSSISSLPRREYLEFFENFFNLMNSHIKKTTRLAFINADWRDFQNKPALDETPEGSILIDDYLNILKKSGWKRTHIIQTPLSSERFDAGIVSAMQKKRILGVTSRYLIIAKKR